MSQEIIDEYLYNLGWETQAHHQAQKPQSDKLTSEKLIFVCLKYKQKGSIQTGGNICINNRIINILNM